MSVNGDGTVLFFTPKGKMLADAPPTTTRPDAGNGRLRADAPTRRRVPDAPTQRVLPDAPTYRRRIEGGMEPGQIDAGLPPVPSGHPGAPATDDDVTLSNGAALYRDSDIPWEIEAAAREALEESLG